MAREYARIRISIAGDADVEELTLAAQWLYFRVLIPEAKLSHCGVADWRPRRLLGKARGLTLATVLEAAAELEAARFALFDDDTEEVLVRSYVRSEELFRNPKMAVAVADAFLGVASKPLRAAVVAEVRRAQQEHPEYSSWSHAISRDAVSRLLSAPGPDQVPYPRLYAVPNSNGAAVVNGNGNGLHNPIPNTDPDTGSDYQPQIGPDSLHLAPTPLQPAPSGGYVSPEGHQADDPDPANDPPPRFCPQHMPDGGDRSKPCRACGEHASARRVWDLAAEQAAQRAERQAAQAAQTEAAVSAAMAIVECPRCDDDGYVGTVVCSHRDHASAEAREAAKAAFAASRKGGDA